MRFPRASGVLLHPTSLPGPHGSGDFGANAYHFVDWLVAAGQKLWQILPLGGIGPGNSPYMSTSAFAGNVLLIDLAELQRRGWLTAEEITPPAGLAEQRLNFASVVPFRMDRLARAAQRFAAQASAEERADLQAFCERHADWLPEHVLFMTLAEQHNWRDWSSWDAPLAARNPVALAAARQIHAERIAFWTFCQWCFFRQWLALKAYANGKGIAVIGDAPIFIAHQSAEVWARPELFQLDARGRPSVVAGVPPDVFSETGQRWGNPLYRWEAHARDGYAWWVQRIRRIFELVDIVRIDHFRGFAGYWEIPASEATAVKGRWLPGPGEALFEAIARELGALPIIAEDLGVITPDVVALRRQFAFPGMRILQFAFEGGSGNAYLPHNHEPDTVVYTGTHDNDTTLGWYRQSTPAEKLFMNRYLGGMSADICWDLMRAAWASVAVLAIAPLQDVLSLGSEARMNLPGQPSGWWRWRFAQEQLTPAHVARLREMTELYERG